MIFILIKKSKDDLGNKEKCSICSEVMQIPYKPMKDWSIDGTLCGKCYSKKIAEHYPGSHVRVNKEE